MWMNPAITSSAALLTSPRCLRRGRGVGRKYDPSPRVAADDLPWKTRGEYGGLGGASHFETPSSTNRTPILFVHGNTHDARDWYPVFDRFLERGYRGDELWAITFRERSSRHDEMAAQLDAFVRNLREHTGSSTVNVVGHSLGVTGLRHWLGTYERYEWVDTFVGLAGANHGTYLCTLVDRLGATFGPGRPAPFLNPVRMRSSTHPLTRLNENETPGDVTYHTIRGAYDQFFPRNPESPRLAGAKRNVVLPTNHRGVRTHPNALELLYWWLSTSANGGSDRANSEHQRHRSARHTACCRSWNSS